MANTWLILDGNSTATWSINRPTVYRGVDRYIGGYPDKTLDPFLLIQTLQFRSVLRKKKILMRMQARKGKPFDMRQATCISDFLLVEPLSAFLIAFVSISDWLEPSLAPMYSSSIFVHYPLRTWSSSFFYVHLRYINFNIIFFPPVFTCDIAKTRVIQYHNYYFSSHR